MKGLRAVVPLLVMASFQARAIDFAEGRFQLHGFASQAVVHSSENQFFGDSTNTSFEFTELGLNASWRPQPSVLVATQILSRRAGEMYDGKPTIDFALVDLALESSTEHRFGVRAGRIKNAIGLYNETRDVAFTRPSIFLPQVIYYDKLRNTLLSTDGLGFYGEASNRLGNLSAAFSTGRAATDKNVEWAVLGRDAPGDLEQAGLAWAASIWYSDPSERIKLGLSTVSYDTAFDPDRNGDLQRGTADFFEWVASVQVDLRQWTISAEYARAPLEWTGFGPGFPFRKEVIEGYYLQGAYRIRQNLELMMRYEEGFADRNDKDGSRLSAMTGGATAPSDFYSKTWTAGLRWDIRPDLMLRLEYQKHLGTFDLSIRENPLEQDRIKDWSVMAASLSFRF